MVYTPNDLRMPSQPHVRHENPFSNLGQKEHFTSVSSDFSLKQLKYLYSLPADIPIATSKMAQKHVTVLSLGMSCYDFCFWYLCLKKLTMLYRWRWSSRLVHPDHSPRFTLQDRQRSRWQREANAAQGCLRCHRWHEHWRPHCSDDGQVGP